MDRPAFERGAGSSTLPAGANWFLRKPLLELLGSVERCRHPQQLAIETINERSVGPAQPDRTFDHSFEYHLEIERRAADDLENFGGRGLLLPRLGKFAGESCDLGIFG